MPTAKSGYKGISFIATERTYQAIKRRAAQEGLSMSDIIRRIILEELDRRAAAPAERGTRR